MQNVFFIIAHECAYCVQDLVENLETFDPSSKILLINGGPDPALLEAVRGERLTILPDRMPRAAYQGVDVLVGAMIYAVEQMGADLVTNVDSDQLLVHGGYSKQMAELMRERPTVGLFSVELQQHSPQYVIGCKEKLFKQPEDRALWEAFARQYENGMEKMALWAFWPAAAFTAQAVAAIKDAFHHDPLLGAAVLQTRAPSMEESILPPIVLMAGMEALQTSWSHRVRWRPYFSIQDAREVVAIPDCLWAHPVARVPDDPARQMLRDFAQITRVKQERLANPGA